MGGTSAKQDWNPDFGANAWDKGTDNGTSAFLKDLRTAGPQHSNPKREQYLQATYNLRLMREQLRAAGVAHEFKGVFWRQSSADSDSDWKKYGADQIRIFNAIRAEVEVPDLPIIMEGDGSRTNLQGGKVYAAKVLCHATVGTSSSNQQLSSTIGKGPGQCAPMISDPCTSHRHYNGELDNQFGWPVGFPEEYKFPKPGHSAATSQWVVRFQSDPGPPLKNPNMHDDYAGMWWNGVAMANAYVTPWRPFVCHGGQVDVVCVCVCDWYAQAGAGRRGRCTRSQGQENDPFVLLTTQVRARAHGHGGAPRHHRVGHMGQVAAQEASALAADDYPTPGGWKRACNKKFVNSHKEKVGCCDLRLIAKPVCRCCVQMHEREPRDGDKLLLERRQRGVRPGSGGPGRPAGHVHQRDGRVVPGHRSALRELPLRLPGCGDVHGRAAGHRPRHVDVFPCPPRPIAHPCRPC